MKFLTPLPFWVGTMEEISLPGYQFIWFTRLLDYLFGTFLKEFLSLRARLSSRDTLRRKQRQYKISYKISRLEIFYIKLLKKFTLKNISLNFIGFEWSMLHT